MATSATSRSTRPDPDPHQGPFGRLLGDFVAPSALRGRPPRPQQHHGKGDAGHRDRHPGAAEEGAGAVGERGSDRSGEVGPEAEGAEHADHTSPTAAASARWPTSWRDAAARPFASALGPCEAGRDRVVDRFWGRFRADGLALERERPLPRVLVAGIPAR